jgi:hypothetical protein
MRRLVLAAPAMSTARATTEAVRAENEVADTASATLYTVDPGCWTRVRGAYRQVTSSGSTTAGTSRTHEHPHGSRISEQRLVVILLITRAMQAPRLVKIVARPAAAAASTIVGGFAR